MLNRDSRRGIGEHGGRVAPESCNIFRRGRQEREGDRDLTAMHLMLCYKVFSSPSLSPEATCTQHIIIISFWSAKFRLTTQLLAFVCRPRFPNLSIQGVTSLFNHRSGSLVCILNERNSVRFIRQSLSKHLREHFTDVIRAGAQAAHLAK